LLQPETDGTVGPAEIVGADAGLEEETMRLRRGALATSAGTLALVVLGGPMLAGPAFAAQPRVVVRQGDTLSAIAARYHTTAARLAALNHLRNPDLILPGQVLVIPGPSSQGGSTNPARAATERTHVVRQGENLTSLAVRYGTSVAAIVAANGISNPNRIYPGQRLRIPGTGPAANAAAASNRGTSVHWVSVGETLSGIAMRYGTSVAVLVNLNGLASANYIRAGQRLVVPDGRHGSSQTSSSTPRFSAETRAVMARRSAIRSLIVSEARRTGVPPALALAVGWQESGWRQGVVSSAGAIGVMQLLPATAAWVADTMLHAGVDIHRARSNVRTGVALLKHYLFRYRGDRRLALAAYYQGQRAVDKYGIFPVSRPYIASILLLEEMLQP
jgi:LysM repeat protein